MRSPARLTTTAFIFLTVLLLAGASGGLPVRGQTDGTPLLAGGNYVTYLGPTLPVQDALGDIAADIEAVWWLDPASSGWIAWSEAVPAALRGFAELEHGEAYFLIVSSAVTWTVPAAPIRDRNVVLAAGGNSVGYSGVATPVDTAFGGAFDQIESVWRFHAASQAWQGWSPALPAALVPFDTLEPGRAYWVVVAAAATWQQRAPEPDAPDADLLARTGVEWQRLETGDVFAAAIVTDAVAGPTGYLAVGYTDDDAAQPRAWHSADGVTWCPVISACRRALPWDGGVPISWDSRPERSAPARSSSPPTHPATCSPRAASPGRRRPRSSVARPPFSQLRQTACPGRRAAARSWAGRTRDPNPRAVCPPSRPPTFPPMASWPG